VQGTAEKNPFSKEDMDRLILLAEKGILELTALQRRILKIDL
jgi:ribonuclease PH